MGDDPRPEFAHDFPRSVEVDAVVDAFARGDYAAVRAAAPALERSADPCVRASARALLSRTRPEPIAVTLLCIALALFLSLAAWSVGR